MSPDEADSIWQLHEGPGPLLATAIHAGHAVRADVATHLALSNAERLREEDPFTDLWTTVAPTRILGIRSRFEVDLNRPREKAVYRTPEDAWGLHVWRDEPPTVMFDRSLAEYDRFYRAMKSFLEAKIRQHGRILILDLHSYNHRRDGAAGAHANIDQNPQVNIGTGTMNRERWSRVVDTFIEQLRSFEFPGGRLDVRENIKFLGGYWPRWIHEHFPDSAVAIAVEFKKFFMDEWTGAPDYELITSIENALASTIPHVLRELEHVRT